MGGWVGRTGLSTALFLLYLVAVAVPAHAAEFPPEFDATLSLKGDCTTESIDPVADPSCPYSAPPAGPSGRFDEPKSIAIDAFGNEYVASYAGTGKKGRIDIFDDEGKFITELPDPFGPKSVAVDSEGNLYVYEQSTGTASEIARYSPTIYEPEAGKIVYGNPRVVVASNNNTNTGGIAVDVADKSDVNDDRLYVDWWGTASSQEIKIYGPAAEGNKLLDTITGLSSSNWLAVDAQRRRLYASYCQNTFVNCGVKVLEADAPYAELEVINGPPGAEFLSSTGWLSIAVDEEKGDFFIDDLQASKNIYQFDENYDLVSKLTFENFSAGNPLQIAVSNGLRSEAAEACAYPKPEDLEVPVGDACNRHVLFVPDQIGDRAFAFRPPNVTPPDVESLAAASVSETEAELQATIDPGGLPSSYVFEYVTQTEFEETGYSNARVAGSGTIAGDSLPKRVSGVVGDLLPATAYRFRVTAQNELGEDEDGEEGVFTTFSDAPISKSCANQVFRIGPSASLPDCRGYELVTPPDTGGLPPKGTGFSGDNFSAVQVSPFNETVGFVLQGGALPGTGASGAFEGDHYRAARVSTGWTTVAMGPSGVEAPKSFPGTIGPDQTYAFWSTAEKESGATIPEGNQVQYPDGHSELVGRGSLGTDPNARGKLITENGTHIVFQTEAIGGPIQLEPNAPPTGTRAVYDRTPDEVTHVVSLLPGDLTPAAGEGAAFRTASPDGNGIAFEIINKSSRAFYLRVNNTTTYKIGEDEDLELAGVSEGGERAFYVEGGDLLALDTETEEVIPFSESGDVTVVNVAPQGTRAYFTSPSVLTGEANPNGDVAEAGEQNLYLSEEGDISFVATVTDRDVEGEGSLSGQRDGLGLWTEVLLQPIKDPSRLNPDGSVLLFQSRADLDETDSKGFAQIYRYDSVADRLHCISCNPTRVPATGDAALASFAVGLGEPPPFSAFGFVPNLRPDGKRAFFESTEALVSYDTDEVRDVYEWEEQEVGSCKRPGGCVYLITSGRSARDNYLYGHSQSGDDVYFTTGDVLTGFDAGGTLSIYDARVGGGFAEPNPPTCEGEGCKPDLTLPPALPGPAKPAVEADDQVPRSCPKGKRKVKKNGQVRCVKKKKHHKGKKQRNAGAKKKGGSK